MDKLVDMNLTLLQALESLQKDLWHCGDQTCERMLIQLAKFTFHY